jgi:hypothetical protein
MAIILLRSASRRGPRRPGEELPGETPKPRRTVGILPIPVVKIKLRSPRVGRPAPDDSEDGEEERCHDQ